MYRYYMTSPMTRNRDLQLNTDICLSLHIIQYTSPIYLFITSSSGGHKMFRYSLEEVFGSPEKKLSSFKSRKVTKTGFYCYGNSLAVLEDEETVIGVLGGSNG